MIKFSKEGIELIRNKINLEELKNIGKLTLNNFTRERKRIKSYFRTKKEYENLTNENHQIAKCIKI